jgi:hypothetical protein
MEETVIVRFLLSQRKAKQNNLPPYQKADTNPCSGKTDSNIFSIADYNSSLFYLYVSTTKHDL